MSDLSTYFTTAKSKEKHLELPRGETLNPNNFMRVGRILYIKVSS